MTTCEAELCESGTSTFWILSIQSIRACMNQLWLPIHTYKVIYNMVRLITHNMLACHVREWIQYMGWKIS